jgi:hypothetical protein
MFAELLQVHPTTGWSAYALLAMGHIHEALGHSNEALTAYQQSGLIAQDLIVGWSVVQLRR